MSAILNVEGQSLLISFFFSQNIQG